MQTYRVKEVQVIDAGAAGRTLKTLREYERVSSEVEIVEQVRRFFEIELSSPKALETVDFDAIVVVDPSGSEVARFDVEAFWMREWKDVAVGDVRG